MARAEEPRDVARPRREAPDRPVGRVLRPGVMMPDWSVVTSGTARRALEAAFGVADRHEKCAGLGDEEDRVWCTVLQGFAAAARAPDVDGIAAAAGLPPSAVETVLKRLHARDLVVLDEGTGAVAVAYPFSGWPTGHRVRWDGTAAEALCAIDALGMGAMLGRDAVVDTACRHCGAPIQVATRQHGTEIAAAAPEEAVVWAGMAYAGTCGATSGCTLKVFFCREEHLDAWREAEGRWCPASASRWTRRIRSAGRCSGRCCGGWARPPGGRHDAEGNARDRRAGTVAAAVCCGTPVLAIVLGALGLSAWLTYADDVILPVVVASLALAGYALHRQIRRRGRSRV